MLGGRVERWSNCEREELCVVEDANHVKHGACVDEVKED